MSFRLKTRAKEPDMAVLTRSSDSLIWNGEPTQWMRGSVSDVNIFDDKDGDRCVAVISKRPMTRQEILVHNFRRNETRTTKFEYIIDDMHISPELNKAIIVSRMSFFLVDLESLEPKHTSYEFNHIIWSGLDPYNNFLEFCAGGPDYYFYASRLKTFGIVPYTLGCNPVRVYDAVYRHSFNLYLEDRGLTLFDRRSCLRILFRMATFHRPLAVARSSTQSHLGHSIAKGPNEHTVVMGADGCVVLFDIRKPKDFSQVVDLVEHPMGVFSRYCIVKNHGSSYLAYANLPTTLKTPTGVFRGLDNQQPLKHYWVIDADLRVKKVRILRGVKKISTLSDSSPPLEFPPTCEEEDICLRELPGVSFGSRITILGRRTALVCPGYFFLRGK